MNVNYQVYVRIGFTMSRGTIFFNLLIVSRILNLVE